ncbi:MAG: hypothetical protein U1D70_04750 [Methylobacter sp.]|uniref:hypothetical protein n=1 Tax=Methylicorpusculum sp. TaxID=2713644 RepID=UPI002731347B|nr:hypothetical protein [Methylicorpusculum sp.]MDP2178427.1 hypothetical protein [Methylicorpusculum sp.]MDP2429637.1 hypothetical protein [Methylobacter sp.]MDZ4218317.1 hypothetical protein [Methylobacter sp.]
MLSITSTDNTSDLLNPGKFLVFLGSSLLAVCLGLAASTANPTVISLGVGLMIGGLLLGKPNWNIWLILIFGLLVDGMLPIWIDDSQAGKLGWGISLLGFILMTRSFFKAVSTPHYVRDTPDFVWLAIVFLFYIIALSLLQWQTMGQFFAALKKYSHVYGLLFAFSWLLFDDRTIQRWRKFLVFVAIMQLPAVIYELMVIVPKREALATLLPDIIPIDAVGGTLGTGIMNGGASAEMAFFLIAIMGFLFAYWKMGALSTGKLAVLIPIVTAPLLMGETKAVIIQLPIMFIIVFRQDILAKPLRIIMISPVIAAVIVGVVLACTTITGKTVDQLTTEAIEYNLKEQGYGGRFLNRKTALTFWAKQQGLENPISPVFGNGIGSAEELSLLTPGHIAAKFPKYGIGLTDASQFLWEIGVFGCAIFLAILMSAWITAGLLYKKARDPAVRADGLGIQVTIALLVFHLFYRNALLHVLSFQVLILFALGHLAWLYRQYRANDGANP